jgi:hypothetical protein
VNKRGRRCKRIRKQTAAEPTTMHCPEAKPLLTAPTSILISLISSDQPLTRARIRALRATSMPLRSSRGSGSVYPRSYASSTRSLNFFPSSRPDVIKPSAPLNVPGRNAGQRVCVQRC